MNRLVATVLYEDKMRPGSGGSFPPHRFVLAMVRDVVGREIHDLEKIIDKNPRNGVDKLLAEARHTARRAGSGILCMLIDRDRIAEHLKLPKDTTNMDIVAKIKDTSDAPSKLLVFFLDPNMEGLLESIEKCEPSLRAPRVKDLNQRDIYLKKAASVSSTVRDCVKTRQPSLAEMVHLLATLCANPVDSPA